MHREQRPPLLQHWSRRLSTALSRALLPALAALMILPLAGAAAVLWVTPMQDGAATLTTDGDVTFHSDGGGGATLARSVRGDGLRLCDGHLLGIDADGHLRVLSGSAVGPAVSLHSRPTCLPGGRVAAISAGARSVLLLAPDLTVVARRPLAALPDGDPTPVGDALAVLTQPTQRYRHGILGDEIEAGAVTLLRQDDLSTIATLTVAAPAVIEQLRVQPFPAAGPYGMLITRSTPSRGAGVQAVALERGALTVVASAAPMGSGEPWLNLFAASGDHAYAVRTPDNHGPLERYVLDGSELHVAHFALDVTNHRLGSRNLDLGILLPPPPGAPDRDLLALPAFDLGSVRIVACHASSCTPVLALALDAPLSSNLAAAWRGGRLVLYAGEETGSLQSFMLDASLWEKGTAR